LPALAELGIGVTAYGVLSRGLLCGSQLVGKGDFRAHPPRYLAGNFEQNQQLVGALKDFAASRGVTPSQLAIAWVLAKGESIVPILGARKRGQLKETLGAIEVRLSPDETAELEALVPADKVAGTRYDAGQMRMLDSEK
jgi:aryl-alcohol dehydrogenase-like predicted oxidoreductase